MKWIAPATFCLIAVTAGITLVFVNALKPSSAEAFLFLAVWLNLPNAMLGSALFVLQRKKKAFFHGYGVAALVSVGGVLFLADVIFWHPDAQGAIAVMMTPLLQGVSLALLLPIAVWLSRRTRA